MKIAILTLGSRGDVQPYVALGAALQRQGHQVRLVAQSYFTELARPHGVDLHPAGPDRWLTADWLSDLAARDEGQYLAKKRPSAVLREVMDEVGAHITEYTADALQTCADGKVDTIIGGGVGLYAGHSIAERLGAAFFVAVLWPSFRSSELPNIVLPTGPSWVPGYNRLSHWLGEKLAWSLFRDGTQRLRKSLGLEPYPRSPFVLMRETKPTVLLAASPTVVPPPSDWPPYVHTTGYWFLDEPEDYAPPPKLADFLTEGTPPVCFGFGSMALADPAADVRMIVETLKQKGQRGILLSGWGGLRAEGLPKTVLTLDEAPHAWLLPRMAAFVHHGGAGSTAAAFRAGIPQVVVPVFSDQPFWAERVRRLGAGPAPIPRRKLNAHRLAQALTDALDAAVADQARAVAEQVNAEDGPARAIQILTAKPGET